MLSRVQLFATPWTVAHQALLSMEFSRQEYQSALPFPPPGGLSTPGIELRSSILQADSSPSELAREAHSCPENSMDRGAWWTTVHRVTESLTQLSD